MRTRSVSDTGARTAALFRGGGRQRGDLRFAFGSSHLRPCRKGRCPGRPCVLPTRGLTDVTPSPASFRLSLPCRLRPRPEATCAGGECARAYYPSPSAWLSPPLRLTPPTELQAASPPLAVQVLVRGCPQDPSPGLSMRTLSPCGCPPSPRLTLSADMKAAIPAWLQLRPGCARPASAPAWSQADPRDLHGQSMEPLQNQSHQAAGGGTPRQMPLACLGHWDGRAQLHTCETSGTTEDRRAWASAVTATHWPDHVSRAVDSLRQTLRHECYCPHSGGEKLGTNAVRPQDHSGRGRAGPRADAASAQTAPSLPQPKAAVALPLVVAAPSLGPFPSPAEDSRMVLVVTAWCKVSIASSGQCGARFTAKQPYEALGLLHRASHDLPSGNVLGVNEHL